MSKIFEQLNDDGSVRNRLVIDDDDTTDYNLPEYIIPDLMKKEEPSNFKVLLTPTVIEDFTLSEYIEAHVENSIFNIDLEALIELRVDQRMQEMKDEQEEMLAQEYDIEDLFEEYHSDEIDE